MQVREGGSVEWEKSNKLSVCAILKAGCPLCLSGARLPHFSILITGIRQKKINLNQIRARNINKLAEFLEKFKPFSDVKNSDKNPSVYFSPVNRYFILDAF